MQKGFKRVVVTLIRAKPGLTLEEYARQALERGLCGSDSKNPVMSLAKTVYKEWRGGRMPEIKAVKVNGRLHWFPVEHDFGDQGLQPKSDSPLAILLPLDVAQRIDTLVELGKHANRGEALTWLAREGIKAKLPELERAEQVTQQIKRLKESFGL